MTGAEKLQPSAQMLLFAYILNGERAYAHDAFCGAVFFRNDDHESGKSIGSAWTS